MNLALFGREIRTSFPLFLLFAGLTGMAAYVILTNPLMNQSTVTALLDFGGIMPGSLALYLVILVCMLLLFALILSNRSVTHQIANRRMSYLLASPNSRRSIVATKRFSIAFLLLLFTVICSAIYGWLTTLFTQSFDGRAVLLASLGAFSLVYALSGLMFLFACCFRRCAPSVLLSLAVCAVFAILRTLAAQGGMLTYCRFFTPFALFDLSQILVGETLALIQLLVLFLLGILLQSIAFSIFCRKNFDTL